MKKSHDELIEAVTKALGKLRNELYCSSDSEPALTVINHLDELGYIIVRKKELGDGPDTARKTD